ncbi:glycosyl hydrolase [uncultured Chryseobacterium sp.]|uniref:WD40/YVTN/BNR-like repeat-containing protein n=1 Tax=uncultured Chryseobacterium sp. TaxID=259322 RepID=UPI00261F1B01|nr:glycosyl hydrolase [uncultured Chryseobacterium sp.]
MNNKIFLLIFSVFLIKISAQKPEFQMLLKEKISIRAIQIWDGKVWYAGTDSKFGYISLKDSADKKQMILSDKKLQFRTLAQDRNAFYAINVESPAYFFRIDKKSLKSKTVNTDNDKNAFYDALHYSDGMFYTFSDPNSDLNLKFVEFNLWKNQFISKIYTQPKLNDGEAAFAASNSNIASSKKHIWIATGGKSSRIFRMNRSSKKFEVFSTPIIQGESSQGMYTVDFFKDKFGIAAGGDYTKQTANINNIATTTDAGKTWQIQASGNNAGYTTCVKIRPGSKGKEILAVGDQHISISKDFGKTWSKISDEKGFFVAEWVDKNTVVLAGSGKIVMMKF